MDRYFDVVRPGIRRARVRKVQLEPGIGALEGNVEGDVVSAPDWGSQGDSYHRFRVLCEPIREGRRRLRKLPQHALLGLEPGDNGRSRHDQ